MSKIPFLSISVNELKNLPDSLNKGDKITCPRCNKKHVLKAGKTNDGIENTLLLFYKCEKNTYLASIDGKSIMHRKTGSSGKI